MRVVKRTGILKVFLVCVIDASPVYAMDRKKKEPGSAIVADLNDTSVSKVLLDLDLAALNQPNIGRRRGKREEVAKGCSYVAVGNEMLFSTFTRPPLYLRRNDRQSSGSLVCRVASKHSNMQESVARPVGFSMVFQLSVTLL